MWFGGSASCYCRTGVEMLELKESQFVTPPTPPAYVRKRKMRDKNNSNDSAHSGTVT